MEPSEHINRQSSIFRTFVYFGCVFAGQAPRGAVQLQKRHRRFRSLSGSVAELVKEVRPSVVQIRTVGFGPVEGAPQGQVTSEREGPGFVLDIDGYIVTNAHVVRGARHIEVRLDESNLTAPAVPPDCPPNVRCRHS